MHNGVWRKAHVLKREGELGCLLRRVKQNHRDITVGEVLAPAFAVRRLGGAAADGDGKAAAHAAEAVSVDGEDVLVAAAASQPENQ